MYDKELNSGVNGKVDRYKQIDFIGSYGVKDDLHIGVPSRNNDQEGTISLLGWIGIIFISIIPVINVLILGVTACADVNLNIKNYAKAALIVILVLVLSFLMYL